MKEFSRCFNCGADLDKGRIRSYSPIPMSKFWIPEDSNLVSKVKNMHGIPGGSPTYYCENCGIYIIVEED